MMPRGLRAPQILFVAAALGVALVCLVGCDDDSVAPNIKPPVASPYPFPGSEDQLAANFHAAYEAMDAAGVIGMLRHDSVTFLQSITQAEFPDLGPTLDYDEEARCALRMLSGAAVTDPHGTYVPGLGDVSFEVFEKSEAWRNSTASDAIDGVRTARYAVSIIFDRPGYSTLRSQGEIRFFVAARDSLHQGATRSYWQLVGQLDLTAPDKAVERAPWGTIKALYRTSVTRPTD